MIISSGHTGVWIDIGDNKPGMKLQRRERGQDWKNCLVNRRVVKSPIDIERLPAGKHRKKLPPVFSYLYGGLNNLSILLTGSSTLGFIAAVQFSIWRLIKRAASD